MESEFKKFIVTVICIFTFLNLCSNNNQGNIIKCWKINDLGNPDSIAVDTLWNKFQIMNPIYKYNISNTYLGGLGTATISNNFFSRSENEYFFLNSYTNYLHLPENVCLYNTKKPFTQISYTSSTGSKTKQEQSLNVLHTQNINPNTNVGFNYYTISDKGNYKSTWERSSADFQRKRSKINSLLFFLSHASDNYSFNTSAIVNSVGPNEEIGGITYDSAIYYLNQSDTVDRTEVISTRLIGAKSELNYQNYSFNHEFKLGNFRKSSDSTVTNSKQPVLGILHEIEYNKIHRVYIDKGGKGFYNSFYIDSNLSFDSTYFRSFKNTIKLKLYENPQWLFRFGGYAGLEAEFKKFSYNTIVDTVIQEIDNIANEFDNVSILWENNDTVFNKLKDTSFFESTFNGLGYIKLKDNLQVDLAYNLILSGYRSGDLDISTGLLTNIPIRDVNYITKARIGRISSTPSYFYQSYQSNHHIWENSFDKEKREWASVTMSLDTNIFSVGANYSRIKNYTYLGPDSNPVQEKSPINIFSIYANYYLRLWKFYFDNKVIYQTTDASNSILSLPSLSLNNSTYFQFILVKNVLSAQIGFDLYYDTKFYSSAYDPSTGQFYVQDQILLGNYPYVDVFLNAKWKRARIFVTMEHANAGLKFTNRNYFSALHYPRNFRWVKLGISWTFYD